MAENSIGSQNPQLHELPCSGSKRKADQETSVAVPPTVDYYKYIWLRYFDPNSVKFYYHNSRLNATQWEYPKKKDKSQIQKSPLDEKKDSIPKDTEAEVDSKNASSVTNIKVSDTELESIHPPAIIDEEEEEELEPIVYDGISWQLLSGSLPVGAAAAPVPVSYYPFAATSAPTIDYSVRASFNSTNGRFAAADGTYWDKVGLPNDRDGRQLSRFMDLSTMERNREEVKAKRAAIQKTSAEWKAYKKEKQLKHKLKSNSWLYSNDDD